MTKLTQMTKDKNQHRLFLITLKKGVSSKTRNSHKIYSYLSL